MTIQVENVGIKQALKGGLRTLKQPSGRPLSQFIGTRERKTTEVCACPKNPGEMPKTPTLVPGSQKGTRFQSTESIQAHQNHFATPAKDIHKTEDARKVTF